MDTCWRGPDLVSNIIVSYRYVLTSHCTQDATAPLQNRFISTTHSFVLILRRILQAIFAVSCCFLGPAAPTIYISLFISEPQFSGRCWRSSQFSLLCQDLMIFFDSVYADHEHTREGVVLLGLTGALTHLVLRSEQYPNTLMHTACHAALNSESPPNWPPIFCTASSRRSSMSSSGIPV